MCFVYKALDLGPGLMGFLQARLLTNLTLVDIVKWSLIAFGSGIGIAGLVKHQMEKNKERNTNEEPASALRLPALVRPAAR